MTQVNLLPNEVRTRQRTRRHTITAIGAAGAVVVLLLGVFVLQSMRLTNAQHELAAQQQVNSRLEGQIAQLHPFDQLRQDVNEREALATSLLNGQVLWSGVMRDLSSVLPGRLWLTSMTGALNQTAAGVSTPTSGSLVGTIQFQGQALEHTTVASWLTRLEQVPGWVNAWVSSSTKGTGQTQAQKLVTFSSSVDLSTDATATNRRLP